MRTDIKMTRAWAEIDLAAIRQNYTAAAAHAASHGAKIAAVIKANAYGHGAIEVARELSSVCGANFFAVATFPEAVELVEGGISSDILILSEIHPSLYPHLVKYKNIIPTVFHIESAKILSDAAISNGTIANIFLALDTGMSRIGIECTSNEKTDTGLDVAEEIAKLSGINIEGIFTHYACADMYDKSSAFLQTERFQKFCAALASRGITPKYRSICNSAALTEPEFADKYDLARYGISLYGYYPSNEVDRTLSLKPAMALRARVTNVKTLDAGMGISYGHTFVTDKPTRVATIPVGYADGYPRLLSNKAGVIIDDKYAPILGRVCMDQMMVDVTDIPSATVGSVATLMGADERVRADRLADMIGTISYELICAVSARVPRIYTNAYHSINSD